jgi:hypothetical protein
MNRKEGRRGRVTTLDPAKNGYRRVTGYKIDPDAVTGRYTDWFPK